MYWANWIRGFQEKKDGPKLIIFEFYIFQLKGLHIKILDIYLNWKAIDERRFLKQEMVPGAQNRFQKRIKIPYL